MKIKKLLSLLFASGLGASAVAAADVTNFSPRANAPALTVGDPAPPLVTGDWLQGGPVTNFEKGKAYLLEFWATWSEPSRDAIARMTAIYQRYSDRNLVVIGQDCWEEYEALVAPFVTRLGARMPYPVALDDKAGRAAGSTGGKMSDAWMLAAQQNSIPTVFLIDTRGIVVWIGYPNEINDQFLETVVAGKDDPQKAAADYRMRARNSEALQRCYASLDAAMKKKDWANANMRLGEAERLMPEEDRYEMAPLHLKILIGQKDYATAYRFALKSSDDNKDSATIQAAMARIIVTDSSIKKPDLNVAQTLATRANAAARGNDAAILDTLARVQFMDNQKEQAIATQQKAVALASDDQQPKLQKTLDSYRKGKLPKPD